MKVKWLGHSCFLITSDAGVRIITDPYKPGNALNYGEIRETAEIVTVSHDHGDHNNTGAVSGNPEIIRKTVTVKGIAFQGIAAHHDNEQGKKRGDNTIFCFTVDGVKVCHLGDLGHLLTELQAAEIGRVDVMLSPTAGNYTMDAITATRVMGNIRPRVLIPMHYRNEKCQYPIDRVEEFLRGKPNVIRLDSSEVEFKPESLPPPTRIIVLKPAL
jgi:L-ascorbate metabolism protein UlaG (beta-lactamase superfamily)